MQHLAAFGFTASNTGAGVFVNVPALADQFLTVNPNNRFLVPGGPGGQLSPWRLRMAHVMGVGTSVARVRNAYMQRIGFPSVNPINATAAIASMPWYQDFGEYGPQLPYADEWGLEADNTGANVQTGFAMIHDGNAGLPQGERFTWQFACVNGGSTTQATTVANAWTNANISFTQLVPPGTYVITGLDVFGTTLLAARLVNPNAGPRPGAICRAAQTIFPSGQFRYGNLGEMMRFLSYSQPTIDLFDAAAVTAAFTGFMDVTKIA